MVIFSNFYSNMICIATSGSPAYQTHKKVGEKITLNCEELEMSGFRVFLEWLYCTETLLSGRIKN